MRISVITSTLLLLLHVTNYSQSITCSSHPLDSTAEFIGSFVAVADLSESYSQSSFTDFYLENSSSNCQAGIQVCTWLTSTGKTELVLKVGSLTFSEECSDIVDLATVPLFDILAQAAIEQGIALNYVPCSSTCGSPTSVGVLQASCVQRLGSGSSTYFTACDSTVYCERDYTLCCTGGVPSITSVAVPPNYCTGGMMNGCESTCP
jgi:hypothetical protein